MCSSAARQSAGFGLWHIIGVNYLLDRLMPSQYAGLFAFAVYMRVGLWMLVAGLGLGWYSRRLNAIKQLASLMVRLDRS
jgi:hypothetical protein